MEKGTRGFKKELNGSREVYNIVSVCVNRGLNYKVDQIHYRKYKRTIMKNHQTWTKTATKSIRKDETKNAKKAE